MTEYTPAYTGTVTKYVFIESPLLTPKDLALRAYEVSGGVMIKETCFGMQVTGKPDEVETLIARIREFDPSHIYVKDRGFPPGDERRCRANLGGARPGYLGHEFEMGRVRYIARGLEAAATEVPVAPQKREPLDARKLKELMEAEEP